MNRKNWTSALLALVMVISMMTCFVVPTAIAETDTMTLEEAKALDSVQTATADDKDTAYQLASVEDLIWLATGYTNVVAGDTVYLTADLDITSYDTDKEDGSKFADLYAPMSKVYFTIDGLNHKIIGYNDTLSLIETLYPGASVKNLTFQNAAVTLTNYGAILATALYEGAATSSLVTIDNVHIVDSSVKVASSKYYGALMVAYVRGGTADKTKQLTITNSSIVGSTVDANSIGGGYGLFVGRVEGSDNDNYLTMKNCVAYDSTVKNAAAYGNNNGSGLVVGDFKGKSGGCNGVGYFENIGVFNCKYENYGTAGQTSYTAIVTSGGRYLSEITAKNIYAVGNTQRYISDTEFVAMPNVFAATNNTSSTTVTVTNTYVDDTVDYAYKKTSQAPDYSDASFTMFTALALMNKNEAADGETAYADWTIKNGVPVLAGAEDAVPYIVTYNFADDTVILGTDPATGMAAVNDTAKATIEAQTWISGKDGTEWAENWNQVYTSDVVYYLKGTHAYFYTHVDGTSTHTATCICKDPACTACPEQNNVPCSESAARDAKNDVEGGSTGLDQLGYVCELCGYKWKEADLLTVETADGKAIYEQGDAVTVKVTPVANSGVKSFTATVTYDPARLTYTGETNTPGTVVLENVTGEFTLSFTAGVGASDVIVAVSNAVNTSDAPVDFVIADGAVTVENTMAPVGEVGKNESIVKYSISTVDELIWAAANYAKFSADDTLYLTADLNITAYDATAAEGAKFADQWAGFGVNYRNLCVADVDGQNHSIIGYNASRPLFEAMDGDIRNLKIEKADVKDLPGSEGLLLGASAHEKKAVTVSNVHIVDSKITTLAPYSSGEDTVYAANVGFFAGFMNNRACDLTFENCSLINCVLDASANGDGYRANRGTGLCMGEWVRKSGSESV